MSLCLYRAQAPKPPPPSYNTNNHSFLSFSPLRYEPLPGPGTEAADAAVEAGTGAAPKKKRRAPPPRLAEEDVLALVRPPPWPLQDILSLIGFCARIDHPFIAPPTCVAHTVARLYATLLRNIRPAFKATRVQGVDPGGGGRARSGALPPPHVSQTWRNPCTHTRTHTHTLTHSGTDTHI